MDYNIGVILNNVLFRYSNPRSDYFLDEFKNLQIHFSRPEHFNDPFDCQMEYLRALEDALEGVALNDHYSVELLKDKLEDVLSRIGVCCFCRAKKNQLMWAHYAEKHTGICIGFNRRELLRNLSVTGVEDVAYQSQHPLHNISGQIALLAHDEVPSMKRLLEVFIHPLLKTKYSYWKYERETRFIAPNSGLQSISNRAIQSLTFGLKTSDEDKERVYEELKKPQWKHVLLFQFHILALALLAL